MQQSNLAEWSTVEKHKQVPDITGLQGLGRLSLLPLSLQTIISMFKLNCIYSVSQEKITSALNPVRFTYFPASAAAKSLHSCATCATP